MSVTRALDFEQFTGQSARRELLVVEVDRKQGQTVLAEVFPLTSDCTLYQGRIILINIFLFLLLEQNCIVSVL